MSKPEWMLNVIHESLDSFPKDYDFSKLWDDAVDKIIKDFGVPKHLYEWDSPPKQNDEPENQ